MSPGRLLVCKRTELQLHGGLDVASFRLQGGWVFEEKDRRVGPRVVVVDEPVFATTTPAQFHLDGLLELRPESIFNEGGTCGLKVPEELRPLPLRGLSLESCLLETQSLRPRRGQC